MYVSINDGEQKKVYDYSNFSNYFDVPITIGASLDKNGNPFRFFKGVLSDIVIKVDEQWYILKHFNCLYIDNIDKKETSEW